MKELQGNIKAFPILCIDDEGTAWFDFEDIVRRMPRRFLPDDVKEGDEVEMSAFVDEKGRLQLTTRLPHTPVGACSFMKVKTLNQGTAYVDMGLPRDLLIPDREQSKPLALNDRAVVLVCYDKEEERLYGTTRLLQHLKNRDMTYEVGDAVEVLIYDRTPFGWRAVVDGKFNGIILEQEVFHDVKRGKKFKAWVKEMEEGNLVVSLQRDGVEGLEDACRRIMTFLENHKGYMRLNDNSDPEEIKIRLRMSKKTFKKACGYLMREGKVMITKRGVKLVRTEGKPPATEQEST